MVEKKFGHTASFPYVSQARRKWHEQQEAFERQRREHEIQMIAMEAAEVDRRSEEVRGRDRDGGEQGSGVGIGVFKS